MNRYSSSTSSPRRQAAQRRRCWPAASACSASLSQPLARDSGGPRRLLRAVARRWASASCGRPRSSATRPASRCAWAASPEPTFSSCAATRVTSRSNRGDADSVRYFARASTSLVRARYSLLRCARNSRYAAWARSTAVCGCAAASAALAAISSSSAFFVDWPCCWSIFGDRRVRLGQRVAGQPGRQQRDAPVDGEIRHQHVQLLIPRGGFVEIGQGHRDVVERRGNQRPVMDHVTGFQHLAGLGQQTFGGGEIRVRAAGESHRVVGQTSRHQRAAGPEFVTRASQHHDRPACVVQGGGIAAKSQQGEAAPVQHLPGLNAGRQFQSPVERGQPGPGPTGPDQRHGQAGEYIGLAFRDPCLAGRAQRGLEFADPGAHVPPLAQYDTRRLMGHRSLIRARVPRQNQARPGQRITGT